MSLNGSHEVLVRRAPAEVFAVVSDLARAPTWVPGLVEMTQLTPGPVAVGTQFRQRIHLAGRDVEGVLVVSALELGRVFAHTSRAGPAKLFGHFELAAVEEGTRVAHHHEIRLSGLARAMAPLVASKADHNAAHALENLRRLLEEGAAV
jgi:carbon monoxide dehydrogenase subunit G